MFLIYNHIVVLNDHQVKHQIFGQQLIGIKPRTWNICFLDKLDKDIMHIEYLGSGSIYIYHRIFVNKRAIIQVIENALTQRLEVQVLFH